MLSAESFLTSSLRNVSNGDSICRILAASIHAVEPGAAVGQFVYRSGDIINVAGRDYDLSKFRSVRLLGIGKASIAMCSALSGILGTRLHGGLAITKHAPAGLDLPFPALEGGHPVPDAHSLEAGNKAIEFVSSLDPEDLLFCLISGGGSALVSTPFESISLKDMQVLTSIMLASGARVDEINSLRRRLERLKGGGLVRLSNGATIVSLILSDVVGNPLEAIASGPTVPDPLTRRDVLARVADYGLRGKVPETILEILEQAPETPKPGDTIFEKVQNVVVGSNLVAAEAALTQAGAEGFQPYLLSVDLQGEARQIGRELATFLRHAWKTGKPVPRPACIIAGGETTVTLRGEGKGGRNTELALAAVTELANVSGVVLITLATDGEDGSTDAAGAVVTGETLHRAEEIALLPDDFLQRNDSYSFFAALGDLLKPGPTGTNVNDLVFLFIL
jgi:hydroxypyruvate reductase